MAEEIFSNVSEETREHARLIFNAAIKSTNLQNAVKILDNFTNNAKEEDKEFLKFYFNFKMEQMLNGNDFDKR